jgi:hypothetical protein
MEGLAEQVDKKDDKIPKIIDRVLTQIFGKEATHLIYKHLERNYSVKRHEIGEKLELFAKGLEDFLKSGAYVIERRILDDIWSSYGSVRRLNAAKQRNELSFVGEMKLLMREA